MASTVAIATRRRCPSESWWGARPATCSIRTAASASPTRSSACSREQPWLSGPNATSSRTVGMNSWSSGSWKTSPTRDRSSRMSSPPTRSPATSSSPAPVSRPLRWSISVVLPAPLGPRIATRSPWATCRSRPASPQTPFGIGEAQAADVDGAAHAQHPHREQGEEQRDEEHGVGPAQHERIQPRHGGRPAARQHREVDPLAALVAAQEHRGRDAPHRRRVQRVPRPVAAGCDRGAHPRPSPAMTCR